MEILQNKIDFALVIAVHHANPNGDPLNGNRPRETYEGYGEISDVCLKRKIRNRLMDLGASVFVQSDDRRNDGFHSLKERADACPALSAATKAKNREAYAKAACETWMDVRSFGQVFAFKDDEVSVGLYTTFGSINCQLAEKTGFSEEDAALLKEALRTLFENDASSARPDGSMEVLQLYWWKHNCRSGQYASAKVHRLLHVEKKVDFPRDVEDYTITCDELPGLEVEVYSEY